MTSASAHVATAEPGPCRCAEESLLDAVDSRTHRQVQNLQIDQQAENVVVTGRCASYYVKQLVTHAVLAVYPLVKLDNRIQVCVA